MSILKNSILVKAHRYEGGACVSFHTITRGRRKPPHWFFVPISAILRVKEEGSIICNDICSYATLFYVPATDTLRIHFTWLQGDNDAVSGWQQDVSISYSKLMLNIDTGNPFRYIELSYDRQQHPKLDFTAAAKTLQRVLDVPIYKRRLSQALSRSFRWPEAGIVKFYGDWEPYSFGFREIYQDGRDGISGGFLLHHYDDDPRTTRYEMHT